MEKGKGAGHSGVFLLHFELPTPSVWSVFIFLASELIRAVQGWWVSSVLWGASGGAQFYSEALEKPGAVGWEGPEEEAGAGWLGLCPPAHVSLFFLSSVVPGCAHGRRRAESPPR